MRQGSSIYIPVDKEYLSGELRSSMERNRKQFEMEEDGVRFCEGDIAAFKEKRSNMRAMQGVIEVRAETIAPPPRPALVTN